MGRQFLRIVANEMQADLHPFSLGAAIGAQGLGIGMFDEVSQ
jgi:hypothetical protein